MAPQMAAPMRALALQAAAPHKTDRQPLAAVVVMLMLNVCVSLAFCSALVRVCGVCMDGAPPPPVIRWRHTHPRVVD